jgi:hypothetical protein
MKGHIRERSSGRWAVIIEMRDPQSGRRKRKWHSLSEPSGRLRTSVRD